MLLPCYKLIYVVGFNIDLRIIFTIVFWITFLKNRLSMQKSHVKKGEDKMKLKKEIYWLEIQYKKNIKLI